MQGYLVFLAVILLVVMVAAKVLILKRRGIKAVLFAQMDKKDYMILPFALLFILLVGAYAFGLELPFAKAFYESRFSDFCGVALCALGMLLFLFSLLSFGESFRVGLDESKPGKLVTSGIFAYTRNPVYTSFGLVLLGVFLAFPNLIFALFVIFGYWLFNRQVLLEERSLKKIYGEEYEQYCKKVRRYL